MFLINVLRWRVIFIIRSGLDVVSYYDLLLLLSTRFVIRTTPTPRSISTKASASVGSKSIKVLLDYPILSYLILQLHFFFFWVSAFTRVLAADFSPSMTILCS